MRFDILTLFPNMFDILNESILGRAQEKNLININVVNIRDFSKDKHNKVDDTPYGGGAGMVMRADVVYDCYNSVKTDDSKVIYLSPQGKTLDQDKVKELSIAEGYNEIYTYTFFDKEVLKKVGVTEDMEEYNCVKIKNPLSKDFDITKSFTDVFNFAVLSI